MFVYCGNNPTCYVDYYGHAWAKVSFATFNPLDGGMFSPCVGGGSIAGGKAVVTSLRESSQENHTTEYTWTWYDTGEVDFGPMNNATYQIQGAVVTCSLPSVSKNSVSLGSIHVAAVEGYASKAGDVISLVNLGVTDLEASISQDGFEASAITSVWEPQIILNCGVCKIVLSGNVGSIGGTVVCKPGNVKLGLAAGIGGSISIEW